MGGTSVVITCYREGDLLREAVRSAQAQSLPPNEILIVNDASPDAATQAVCRDLARDRTVRVLWRETNGGTAAARNTGFAAATGDLLVPLDADDLLPPGAIAAIAQAFEENPEAGFVCGSYIRQDRGDRAGRLLLPSQISLRAMLRAKPCSLSTNWRLLGTTPLRKSLWERVGGYAPNFGNADLHDVEFWMRALATGCPHAIATAPIYHWRKYLGRNSQQVTPMAWYRVAETYYDLYRDVGLEYRALELLLLGSKWMGDRVGCDRYARQLWAQAIAGQCQLSTFIALGIPPFFLRAWAHYARRWR